MQKSKRLASPNRGFEGKRSQNPALFRMLKGDAIGWFQIGSPHRKRLLSAFIVASNKAWEAPGSSFQVRSIYHGANALHSHDSLVSSALVLHQRCGVMKTLRSSNIFKAPTQNHRLWTVVCALPRHRAASSAYV